MSPKELVIKWVGAFNDADVEKLAGLYSEEAVNHQVANEPVEGRAAIKQMFADGFAGADMVCVPENIFEDGEWAILETYRYAHCHFLGGVSLNQFNRDHNFANLGYLGAE